MIYECVECGEECNGQNSLDGICYVGGEPKKFLEICNACEWPNVITVSITTSNEKYRDAEWLKTAYETKMLSMATIAEMCGVSAMTIYQWLKKHDIQSRKRGYNKKE